LTSQLELGDTAHMIACARLDSGGWGGDKDKLDAALGRFRDGVEDMLRSMTMVINTQKKNDASALNVVDCLLGWKHCRDIEEAATALSMEAYPVDAAGQDDWGDAKEHVRSHTSATRTLTRRRSSGR